METLLPELAKLVAEARGGAEAALEPLLATCERVLALEPEDLDTQRAKVVCLIEMGRYEEAESHCATLGGATYERAYCLYQLNREAEALALLGRGETEGEAAAVLGAQIRYRLGDYAASAAEFKRAAALAVEGGAASEHCTNVLAALVGARDWPAAAAYAASLPAGLEVQQFELAYNLACARIGGGEYAGAKEKLQVALKTCRLALSGEGYTEQDVEVELGVITAQAAFVNQQLGETKAALAAYNTLASFKTELEPAVSAVVANNTVALRGEGANLFDSWKKCKGNLADGLAKKLTPMQRHAFLSNAALLSVAMAKPEQAKECLTTLSVEFPSSAAPDLIEAAIAAKAKRGPEAEALLRAAAERAGAADPSPVLALAQLQLDEKQPAAALRTLHGLRSLATSPAMVGTLVSLHERLGDVDGAAAALEAALAAEGGGQLMQAASSFYSRHGRWAEAAAAQRGVVEAAPRDAAALAALVAIESHVDVESAHKRLARLEMMCPPLEADDAEPIDAEALERAAAPRAAARAQGGKRPADAPADDTADASTHGAGERNAPTPKPRKKRRKKSKHVRYPKGFDPEHPEKTPLPDPERWLPKRERSTYRNRKKDRGRIARGPQGSTSGAARVDDMTTTNVKELTAEEKAKSKAKVEAEERKAAAAAAAAASGAKKGSKKKGKDKW